MAKILSYMMILTGLMLILNLSGIVSTDTLGNVLSWNVFSSMSLLTMLVAAGAVLVAGIAVGGITIGLFGKTVSESSIVALFAAGLLTYMAAALISIKSTMDVACGIGSECRWAFHIIQWIMAVLISGLIIAIIQWWRGDDA